MMTENKRTHDFELWKVPLSNALSSRNLVVRAAGGFASSSRGGRVLRINGFYEGGINVAGDSMAEMFGCTVFIEGGDGIVVTDNANAVVVGCQVIVGGTSDD